MTRSIIGLYAPSQGSGKTTIAEILFNEKKYQCLSFAGPLKQMTLAFLGGMGYSNEQATHMIYNKEVVIPELNITVRKIMQTIGTEWGRETIDEDLWLKAWKARIKNSPFVCVDDVRFENEASLVKEMGGEVWKVIRPSKKNTDSHKSEGQLDEWEGFDHVIVNDGTLEDLKKTILALV
jgi:hypothetical protein